MKVMIMAIKERSLVQGPYRFKARVHTALPWSEGEWGTSSYGEMFTQNHFPLSKDGDSGGPWLMKKFEDIARPAHFVDPWWEGMFCVGGPSWSPIMPANKPVASDQDMRSLGTTAMARSMPTNPSFDAAVAFGEITREGVPSMIGLQTLKSRSLHARNAGSEYLNVEFGWKPLVSEIRGLAKAVKQSERTWASYRKGSGHKTRVGYHFPSESDTQFWEGSHFPVPIEFGAWLQGTTTLKTSSKSWFNGAFKYYVPEPVGFAGKMSYWSSQADRILGVRLDPSVVWNLAPWSWAVDWFSNTGDLIHNISQLGNDGLVLQYGYQMAGAERIVTSQGSYAGVSVSRETRSVWKKRIPATPFGFSADLSAISSKQAAILVALGLSRT